MLDEDKQFVSLHGVSSDVFSAQAGTAQGRRHSSHIYCSQMRLLQARRPLHMATIIRYRVAQARSAPAPEQFRFFQPYSLTPFASRPGQ